ncbi:unnamed protein product [Linum tenue]|nr:unnamed protein product [Linum tenue]
MVTSESLQLHSPGLLLLPRENRDQKLELSSYEVPTNKRVIVNAWAINRDPRYWVEPEKLYPERFLDCSTDYNGNFFQFIPFGAGRRICPGISFVLTIVKLTLANLLYHFQCELPSKGIDMNERFKTSRTRETTPHLDLIPVLYDVAP